MSLRGRIVPWFDDGYAVMPELTGTPSVPPPLDVTMLERSPRSVDAEDWDTFVRRCDGSFLGAWHFIRANRFLRRIRVFEFLVTENGERRKIGQCAVALGARRIRFMDRLHLLPEWTDHWNRCVQLLVERCGAGVYEYGSLWNAESRSLPDGPVGRRSSQIRPGPPFLVDRVDFGRWPSFAHYRADVSENIRRDYRKAVAAAATVETREGWAALADVMTLVRLRGEVLRRNREPFSFAADLARHVLKILSMGKSAFISTVRAEGRCRAAFFGVRFGGDVYYLAGGTEKTANGYGSYLFLTLIEGWFAADPRGRLFLGPQLTCVDPMTYKRGNQLYRRKLRATAGPGTAFQLRVGTSARAPEPADPALVGSGLRS
jgi:hypothetical protein